MLRLSFFIGSRAGRTFNLAFFVISILLMTLMTFLSLFYDPVLWCVLTEEGTEAVVVIL